MTHPSDHGSGPGTRSQGHLEVLRRGPRPAGRLPGAVPRGGTRSRRRERRGQVDPHQDPRRSAPTGHRPGTARRRAGRLPRSRRRPRRRYRRDLPGADALSRPLDRREHLHGPPAPARPGPDRPQGHARRDPGPDAAPRCRARPRPSGARPVHRRPADRRDRQGALLRRPRPDHGRAHRGSDRQRGGPPLRRRRARCANRAPPSCSSRTAWRRSSRSARRSPPCATAPGSPASRSPA